MTYSFDPNKKVFIVAEIGNNHEGSFDLAIEMVEAAAKTNHTLGNSSMAITAHR